MHSSNSDLDHFHLLVFRKLVFDLTAVLFALLLLVNATIMKLARYFAGKQSILIAEKIRR